MKTKTCSKCNKQQKLEEFSLKNRETGRRDTQCKTCKREYVKSHYQANKAIYKKRATDFSKQQRIDNGQKLVEYLKNHPCVDCRESDIVVLQFDHIKDKYKGICQMMRGGYAWARIAEEITKCEVRCANCHTRKTAKEFKWKYKM